MVKIIIGVVFFLLGKKYGEKTIKKNKQKYKIEFEDLYDGTIIFDNPDYKSAFLGVTTSGSAVYDYDLMVDHLIETKFSKDEEEAMDFICYNDSYSQEGYPLILIRKE